MTYTGAFIDPNGNKTPFSNTTTAPHYAFGQFGAGLITLTVTPTLTWTADGAGDTSPAPPTVSYIEQGAVNMEVADVFNPPHKGIVVTMQTADDGFHDAKTTPAVPQYGVSSSGYRAIDSVSPTSLLPRTVTAHFTFNSQSSDPVSSSGYGASYSLSPVVVTPTGCNAAYQALTGQQITGTLSGIPTAVKVTTYTWSFTGATTGNPIKTWNDKGTAADGKTPQQLFPLLPADLTQTDTTGNGLSVSPISFYDLTGDNKFVIKCAVGLKFPDGTTQTVTAQSPTISFMKPTASWTVNSAPPYLPRPLPASENPGFYSDNATYMQATEWWDPITITDPTGFTGGKGSLAQITTPSRTSTRIPTGTGHATYTIKIQSPPGSGIWISPGTGLDGSFPYADGWTDDGYGHQDIPVYDSVNGYMWDVSSTGHSQDVPHLKFYPPDAGDNGGTNWTYAKDADSFSTWLMYRPPANGSFGTIWIPLQHLTWNWGGTANKSGATWAITSPVFSPGSPAVYPTPPAWDDTIVNDTQHY